MSIFRKPKKLSITDDDGMIALVNIEQYNHTLKFQKQWTWKQLHDFLLGTNNGNLIVFGTGREEEWTLEFLINKESSKTYFRKFVQYIKVTDQSLHLASWTDITSTLQFSDTMLPDATNADLKITLANGSYQVIVKQLFDPEDDDYDAENTINFVVELLQQASRSESIIDRICWADDMPRDDRIFLDDTPNEFDDLIDQLISNDKKQQ